MANPVAFLSWLMMLLNLAAVVVLAMFVRHENKKWLLGFLILLLVPGAAGLISSELYRSDILSPMAYQAYIVRTNGLFGLLRLAGWISIVIFAASLRTLPAAAGAVAGTAGAGAVAGAGAAAAGASPAGAQPAAGGAAPASINGILFPDASRAALCERLKTALPGRVEVAVSGRRPNEILVRDGMWRGATLKTDDLEGRIRLLTVTHDVPSAWGRALIFIASIVLLNLITMMLFASFGGRVRPGTFVLGGAAGFALYTLVKLFFVAGIRSRWAPELNEGIAKLQVPPAA